MPPSSTTHPRLLVLVTTLAACALPPSGSTDPTGPSSLAVVFGVVVAVTLTLALLHFLLFLFEPVQRLHLLFAVVASAFAAVALFDYRERIGAPIELPLVGELQRFAVSALILTAARFTFGLFLPRAPRRYWAYVAAISALLAISMVDDGLFDLPAGLLGLVVMADVLLLLARNWRSLAEGAWIVALGAALFSLGGVVQLTLDLLNRWELADALAPYLWGGLSLILAISIYLASTFARTHRELAARLVEVETLSRQRLEQEKSAREEEVRRRLLEADNRRKTEELEAARSLQLGLLPEAPPTVDGLEVAAAMRTATEVGGDYYDFHTPQDGSLTVVLADAVGHGARAGTLVVAIKSLFQLVAPRGRPADELERLSKAMRGMGLPRAHVALTLARLDARQVEVASAGMPPMLVRRAAGGVEEILLGGVPLGGPNRFAYESRRVELAEGDVVLFFSDGLPELPDADGEPLGYEGLEGLLAGIEGASARGVIDELMRAAERRTGGGPPPDDVTLVAVRIEAPAPRD